MNYNQGPNKPVPEYQLKEFQELINSLFRCCQERITYQSNKFGLPDAELRCLMLFKEQKYLTSKDIAKKMGVGKSRMTRIISGMEKRGLIKRIKDPEDSRSSLISLTTKGVSRQAEIDGFQNDLHAVILSQVGEKERKRLLNNLGLLRICMETGKEYMK